jgi:hypothetical protein
LNAGDIIQFVASMKLFGQVVENVYHWVAAIGRDDDFVLQDAADYLDLLYAGLATTYMVDDLTMDHISAKNLTALVDYGSTSWPTLNAGLSTSDPLPSGVAGLCTFPTAVLKTRGRKFLPGLGENSTDDGVFIPDYMDNVEDYANFILSGFTPNLTLVHYTLGVVNQIGNFIPFQAALISNIPAYQRRRKQGVGQ